MPRWALVAAVVVALVPAAWFTATRALEGDGDPPGSSQSTDKPIPPVSSGPTTTPTTPTKPPTSTPSATPTSNPLPRVAPDVPRRLTSGSILDVGFDNSVEPDGDRFTPGSTSEVARWGTRGEPGSPGTDTVYVVGRVDDDGDSSFGHLAELKKGDEIEIRTDEGTLTYTVRALSSHAESGLISTDLFEQKVPGRLVLVGVRYDASGNRVAPYLLITAQLTAADPGSA